MPINYLIINTEKTNYIIFNFRTKGFDKLHLNLFINYTIITRVESIKYLGIIIDSKLNWSKHICYIHSKIAKGIGVLCKAKKYFTKSTLVTLYYSFIHPYITYCVEVWGSAPSIHTSTIIKLQKKAVRIIVSAYYRAPTSPIFKELNILNFEKVYINLVTLFMFKFDNCMLPEIFDTFYKKHKNVHKYPTRSSENLCIPKIRTTAYKTREGFFRKNIVAVSFFQNCAIHQYS